MVELYPHQKTGAAFLAERGFAFLWDEMGTGKSATVIRACDLVGAQKILVLCPAVVRRHWEAEFEMWAQPRSQQQIERPINCIEGFVKESPGTGVTIVSHDCLADVAPAPRSKSPRRPTYSYPLVRDTSRYDVIIVDESHVGRDINALRAKNMWMPGELWETARHVWALTGTPIVNSAADLWLPAFGPMRTPVSWFDWCSQYAEMKPDGYNGLKPVGLKNAPALADFLRPHVLRRTLDSIGIELPTLTVRDVPLILPQSALTAAMAGLERWTPAMLQRALESGSELKDAALARVRHALGLIKAEPAAAHVETILKSGDGPVVVFFQHTAVREIMWKHLFDAGYRTSWIDGKVTRNQLRAAKEWFQAGRLDVLLVQTQAGGTGLNLNRAHRVVVSELSWTSVAVNQAIKRCHRIGTQLPVTAEILRARDCWLEDVLASVVTKKERAADALLSLLVSYQ